MHSKSPSHVFVKFNNILKHYFECVNPSWANPTLAMQAVIQISKILLFLSNSSLSVHQQLQAYKSLHTYSKCQFSELKRQNLTATFATNRTQCKSLLTYLTTLLCNWNRIKWLVTKKLCQYWIMQMKTFHRLNWW